MPDSAATACAECGFQNDAASRFCGKCGASLHERCPNCRATVRAEQKFCDQCGRPLGAMRAGVPRVQIPQHLAERILNAPPWADGELKIATVLFADIARSTRMIGTGNPEKAMQILDPMVDIMAKVVLGYEGITRDGGDGIMASFGAAIACEDHAVRACSAALDIQKAMRSHAAEMLSKFGVLLEVRIGINSGPVAVKRKRSGTEIIDVRLDGEPVHVARRLEAIAAPGTILLSSHTLALAEGFVQVSDFKRVSITDVTDRVEVCVLKGITTRMRFHARAARGLSKFVGRQEEIERLGQAAKAAKTGRGQVVALVGEAGVGKSRVFLEFARTPHMQGWLVLEAGSVSYGKATSYLPLVDLLNRYFEIEGGDDERRVRERIAAKLFTLGEEKLLPQMPLFLGALGTDVSDDAWKNLTPAERQRQMFDALKRLLIRESQEQPLCLLFDDLHWIDAETQSFLDMLIESIRAARVLLLVSYRPEYENRWNRKDHFSQERIHSLPAASADELLEALLGNHGGLGPIKQKLIRDTEGNPLFLEESVRSLIEKGVLAGSPGRLRQIGPLPDDYAPPRIDALLRERIDRLQPEVKKILQCAAVIGIDIPRALLKTVVSEIAPDALERGLQELQAAEFLYERTLFPDTEYTFKHSMTRQVAYDGLLTEPRTELHARAARALEALAERVDEHIERLADHAEKGGLWEKALEYLERSGAKAYSLYANAQAAHYFERALEALRHLPVSRVTLEQAVDLRFELRNALLALGETVRILQCLKEIEPLLDALGDKLRRARYAAFRCNYHFFAGEQRDAIAFGNAGLGFARECGDRPVIGELLYRVGQSYHVLGQHRKAIGLLEQSLEFTADKHEPSRFGLIVIPSVVNRTWLVTALVECGDFGAGMSHADRALEIAKSADHQPSEALAWLAKGLLRLRKGEFEAAVGAMKLGLELCDKWSLRLWRPRLASTLGVAYARNGDPGKGLELARQAVADAEQMRLIVDRAVLLVRLGQASLIAGRVAEALALGKEAVEIALAHEAKGDEAWARFLIARSCWVADPQDLEESARQLDFALRLARACEARPLVAFCNTTLGAVHGRRGDHAAARKFAAAADASYQELGMRPLPLDPVR